MDIAFAWLSAFVSCLALLALAAGLGGADSRDGASDDHRR